jgi:hypothetical protein
MSIRPVLAAALALLAAGCGGSSRPEVRILAPADLVQDTDAFERETGCRADVRAYDTDEDVEAIAERRNVDVIAAPVGSEAEADDVVELATVVVSGVRVTVPKRLAPALGGAGRPAGRRLTAWKLRSHGDNEDCARRWIAYVTSQ